MATGIHLDTGWNSSALLRNKLKSNLWDERKDLSIVGYRPYCAYCGKVIADGGDMHEVLVTRGDVQYMKEMAHVIYTAENCVLVHTGRCHQLAATRGGQRKCIHNLLEFMPYERIMEWLDIMQSQMKRDLLEAINLVKEINNEMLGVQERNRNA